MCVRCALDMPCMLWPYNIELLTFILSCWLAFSVCCGVVLAIIAGIAYGYNYCMAEFITLTRSDVRVYVRRGQFLDKPDLLFSKRRSGDEDDCRHKDLKKKLEVWKHDVYIDILFLLFFIYILNMLLMTPGSAILLIASLREPITIFVVICLFPFNASDYQQEVGLRDDSLSEKWMKDQDTRKYAAKLDKYSEEKTFVEPRPQVAFTQGTVYYKFTTSKFRRLTYVPNRIISTTILQSGNSEIVMRQFDSVSDNIPDLINVNDTENYQYDYPVRHSRGNLTSEEAFVDESKMKVRPLAPDIRIRVEDNPTGTLKMRHWRTTPNPVIVDHSPDLDEEAVVYRVLENIK